MVALTRCFLRGLGKGLTAVSSRVPVHPTDLRGPETRVLLETLQATEMSHGRWWDGLCCQEGVWDGVPVWLLSECCWEHVELCCGSAFGQMLLGMTTASCHESRRRVGACLLCQRRGQVSALAGAFCSWHSACRHV